VKQKRMTTLLIEPLAAMARHGWIARRLMKGA
jgi:hypothetical protein